MMLNVVSQAAKSRRHRQVELDVDSAEVEPSLPSGRSRQTNKLSLKARTKKNIQISGKRLLQPLSVRNFLFALQHYIISQHQYLKLHMLSSDRTAG